ncbi:MAG: ester cyclase [Chitinophagaceae bacterium]|nr:ester cyclase [Chitinophagaceae bacterium]
MQLSTNKTAEKLFNAWNSHDAEGVLNIYHDDFVREDVGNHQVYGKDKLMHVVTNYLSAFPDLHFTVDNLVGKKSEVVVCRTASGHHKGKIMNIPATGKFISLKGVSVLNLENHLIKRVWYLWYQAAMLRQMGLLPELHHAF